MELTTKVCQIFEYLLAVKNLSQKVVRNINEFEQVWWQKDLPNFDGCYLNGNGIYEEAWLEVHKQEIPPVPSLPQILNKWVSNYEYPEHEPIIIKQLATGVMQRNEASTNMQLNFLGNTFIQENSDEKNNIEKFEDDLKRVEIFEEWLNNKWKPWSSVALPKKRIQKLYNDLFALHQRIQRESDDLELAWGHGTLNWNVSGLSIQRPLLVTPLELQFDAKKGVFIILPTSKGTSMETDMLANIDLPYAKRLQEMERQIQAVELDLWDREAIEPILKEMVHTINPEGTFLKEEAIANKARITPVITYSPSIFLRKTSGRIWYNELTNAIEKIKNGYPVPDSIKLLTADSAIEALGDERDEDSALPDQTWDSIGEDLLFPLPTNAEQKLIAQKLANGPGVIVQGPPGTGKSHTIANLICHLLAHGKRVLVTSEKERALKVLRDKIPNEIRSLCVSVLGADSDSVRDIENSIKNIAEGLDSFDPILLKKDIERLKSGLYETRKNKAKYNNLINQAGELENKKMSFDNKEMSPLEMSQWLKKQCEHNWFPDSISVEQQCPLSDNELENFFKLAGQLSKEDIQSLQKNRPCVSELPATRHFNDHAQPLMRLKDELLDKSTYIEGWTVSQNIYSQIDSYKQKVSQILDNIQKIDETWLNTVINDSIYGKDRVEIWQELVVETRKRIHKIKELDKQLIEYEITFAEDTNQDLAMEDLLVIKEKLRDGKEIGWLFKNVTGRKYNYLFEKITINGLSIRKESDADLILEYIERQNLINRLILKWNRTMQGIDGPQIKGTTPRFIIQIDDLLNKLEISIKWNEQVLKPMQPIIDNLGLNGKPNWISFDWFKRIYSGLEVLDTKKKLMDAQIFFNELKVKLIQGLENTNVHTSWSVLLKSCEQNETDSWGKQYEELMRLEGLEKPYNLYNDYMDRLAVVAPKWVNMIISHEGGGKALELPQDWKKAWRWSQCKNYLDDLHTKTNIEEMERLLKIETKSESRILKELVAKSTWLEQIERTTEPQRRSLFAWLKAIQRIGKGTGKYANMYRKEASNEMNVCKGAIPVWIMPIQKVIENISLTSELFDVIIVDESSQSDLFSLCALLRAKKAVIVGDENQISPESVGTDIGEIHKLIARYLDGIPQASRFENKTSLYEMANQVFESKVVLKEHFRCVPEIIQFSNDLMYEGKMLPLRLPMSHEMMDPPVKAIFVDEGFREEDTRKVINRPEAEAIVADITKCCSDPLYDNKTIGVISLQGHDQASLIEELLREAIGEEEMINRRLISGDAYYFQGDERNVIFLSMVAATNMKAGALTKRSDYQRFNVAASRARDQMFLYHSIQLGDLNPQCARYRFLQYCQNPFRVQQEIDNVKDLFESQFEEDVYRIICAHGYRVIPQVKVGSVGKRIDMVIEGMRSRLAIECDGDKWHGIDKWEEDMERQRILERVGWTFWRVRGSSFYRNTEKAMSSLWSNLNEMGIEPL